MNIFARELASLLAEYGKELGSLYGLHSDTHQIFPHKVTRLKRSLTKNITATLNADDLTLLTKSLHLDPNGDEMIRLRAALIAEAVRHLLGGRMDVEVANELGEVTLQLLLGQDPGLLFKQRTDLLSNMRGGLDEQGELLWVQEPEVTLRGGIDDEQDVDVASYSVREGQNNRAKSETEDLEPALEAGVEIYEQGALWLEVARDTHDPGTRKGYLALAQTLLDRAFDLVSHASASTGETSQQQEWLRLIEVAIREGTTIQQ